MQKLHNTTQKGREAEDYACEFLIEQGFAVLERNFHTRFGELDIIAKKDGILHFIEVKSGIGFEPVYNLSPAKLKKLAKTLNIYLEKHRIQDSYCLSALILSKQSANDIFQVHWLENLTIF